ncbi:MYST-family histone acetyltransferase-A [Oxytricha trifallax]|uniref:Histone acetyltransferase n=1 Tax=Oxytricha trifallax TaxID=1172189 RepID=A0A073I0D5_9SPIT|nr:MYST-family histone acetyltransferase-A [Oxytricha trifallax]
MQRAYGKVVNNTQNMHILQINQTNSAEKAGAIKKDTIVKAQMLNGDWHAAKILEADFTKEDDPLIQNALHSNQINQSDVTQIKFKYYVTFVDQNRRLDSWLLQNQIQLLPKQNIDIEETSRQKMKDDLLNKFNKANLFDNDEHAGMDKRQMQDHEEATKIKTIRNIELGGHLLQTWYYSPFPREFHVDTIFSCDFCLDFFLEKNQKDLHVLQCILKHPPGDEIYRDEKLSVFEVDGYLQRKYCENLCLISKLFLDHKTLRYDCSPFRFYVICEPRPTCFQIAGYFSKEKGQVEQNLSCILVLPSYQRKGYGKFLIEFSYELSLIEKRTGTPERPLSDLGFRSYITWWTQKIVSILLESEDQTISIQNIADLTSIDQNDILYVLENFKILRKNDPNSKPFLFTQKEYLEEILNHIGKPSKKVIRENIHWVPHMIKFNKN